MSKPNTMSIREKLSKIQSSFKAAKSKYNSFGKYKYRSAEDVLEALKPYNLEYNVTFTINEELVEFGDLGTLKSIATIHCVDSGDTLSASAYAGVGKAGGMNVAQAFGASSSYAKKYAMGNLLLIDDTADADSLNQHKATPTKSTKPTKEDLNNLGF